MDDRYADHLARAVAIYFRLTDADRDRWALDPARLEAILRERATQEPPEDLR